MRDIKFRGLRVDGGGCVYGSLVHTFSYEWVIVSNYDKGSLVVEIDRGSFHIVEPNTVEQFTGLSDKNGVEIYEGDILRIAHDNINTPVSRGFEGFVTVINGCWVIDAGEDYCPLFQEIAEFEIVGNLRVGVK